MVAAQRFFASRLRRNAPTTVGAAALEGGTDAEEARADRLGTRGAVGVVTEGPPFGAVAGPRPRAPCPSRTCRQVRTIGPSAKRRNTRAGENPAPTTHSFEAIIGGVRSVSPHVFSPARRAVPWENKEDWLESQATSRALSYPCNYNAVAAMGTATWADILAQKGRTPDA